MFWADEIVKKATLAHKGKSQLIATGITPSGHIHFGHSMEVFVAEAIRKAFQSKKIKAKLIYIQDDFDPFRKVPKGVPESFEKYFGTPLVFVSDPKGDKKLNFATRFLKDFFQALTELELEVEKVSQYQLYKSGKMTDVTTQAIKNQSKIKKILEKVSGRKLDKDWSVVNPLCAKCKKLDSSKIVKVDTARHALEYNCSCGGKGLADYAHGQAKLVWRVDWPAKWCALGVTVEPFGKDHAAAGGSYQSGVKIAKEVFKITPPIPAPYENIHLKGHKGKMSSSVGNLISLKDAVNNFPPVALRYLIMRKKPKSHLIFDPGEGLLQVIDELTKLQDPKKRKSFDQNQLRAFKLSQTKASRIDISFRHLVNAVQAAQGNFSEIKRLLKRTGHLKAGQEKALKTEIERVKNWLVNYAPESVKFELKKEVPDRAKELQKNQKELLKKIIKTIEKDPDPETLHNFIYDTGKELALSPKESFEAVYISLLGKTSGPKAGWFLAMLNKNFVIKRFKEVSK